ncbi:unnamed protein product [Moneuplotes crassus]|uniref:Uncharacterized protein n=1 Tax=Euplotes crassus TaxID=5936 RepID=A0AAD1XWG1_EUPCR|nr:unnamed protein product [Moneuplotes crassus]
MAQDDNQDYFNKFIEFNIPGPRLGKEFLHPDVAERMKKGEQGDEKNVLDQENYESHQRYNHFKSLVPEKFMEKTGSDFCIFPKDNTDKDPVQINQAAVYNIIAKRFHDCMKEESKQMTPEYLSKTRDWELVHNHCAYERLTLFNYLRQYNRSETSDNAIKHLLLKEYSFYFGREDLTPKNVCKHKLRKIFDIHLE